MSTIKVGTIQNTSGVEVYTNKVWCNHNSTGTKAINASGGVSSLSDVSAGRTTYNFGVTLTTSSYSVSLTCNGNTNAIVVIDSDGANSPPDLKSTTQLRINEVISASLGDIADVSMQVVV